MAGIDESKAFKAIGIAVLTVSDTRTQTDDKSGDVLQAAIETSGHRLAQRSLVPDDIAAIRACIQQWVSDKSVDCILTTGGTGFTGRDVTPDAIAPMLDKTMDGFSILFHHLSYQSVGTSTIQSRCLAGLASDTFVFCLPGSPGACRDAWNGILKYQLDSRHRPCNLIDIMPRLKEVR